MGCHHSEGPSTDRLVDIVIRQYRTPTLTGEWTWKTHYESPEVKIMTTATKWIF